MPDDGGDAAVITGAVAVTVTGDVTAEAQSEPGVI
jgi:hypothetical protein